MQYILYFLLPVSFKKVEQFKYCEELNTGKCWMRPPTCTIYMYTHRHRGRIPFVLGLAGWRYSAPLASGALNVTVLIGGMHCRVLFSHFGCELNLSTGYMESRTSQLIRLEQLNKARRLFRVDQPWSSSFIQIADKLNFSSCSKGTT